VRPPVPSDDLHVLRLCSVFEPPAATARPGAAVPGELDARAAGFDPIGGMQNHTASLTRCLDRLGVRQTVITSRLAAPRGTTSSGGTRVLRTGLPVRRLRQLWALDALPSVLRRGAGVDLVHAHQGEDVAVLPLAELVARRAGVPLLVTLHCSVRRTLDRSAVRPRPLTVLGPLVERRAIRRADAVLVLTEPAAEAAVEDGVPPDRVHVVPSGFSPALFAGPHADPTPHVPHPRVLFAGRLAAQKRPLDAVAAHALMADDVHLVVVGDGPLRAELEAAVAASPARDRVHLVGLVPHGEVPGHLAHADAFVLPSQYEELGSVLVEAMASGLPVVAHRVGGIPSLVQDGVTGRLVERGDVPALAAALTDVLTDRRTTRRLAETARAHVDTAFSWPRLAERVHDVYVDVQRR
jgi:2-deoxystreptamine N-acetyl-D-glucosaminyltransferase/2-deoxystreptamine glucosyltransferase